MSDNVPFEQLDYLYVPSRDVERDARFMTETLGGKLVFAIDSMGARVAKVELTSGPPHILLADHVDGDRPIFVYRVTDLDAERSKLKSRGWTKGRPIEIPNGPCLSFSAPGGHRFALYERTRPAVERHFEGRLDF